MLEEGIHEFEFRYQKDSSGFAGEDKAWIDTLYFEIAAPIETDSATGGHTTFTDTAEADPTTPTEPADSENNVDLSALGSIEDNYDQMPTSWFIGTSPYGEVCLQSNMIEDN